MRRTAGWIALVLAGLLGSGCDPCDCGTPPPLERGAFALSEYTPTGDFLDGTADFIDDTLIVEYTDADGNVWQVEYAVTEEYP